MIRKTAASSVQYGAEATALSKRRYGLSAQLFCGVLLSLLFAALVYWISYRIGNQVLSKTVYGNPFITKMTNQLMSELQSYVTDQEINLDDLRPITLWVNRQQNPNLILALYLDKTILYDSVVAEGESLDDFMYEYEWEDPDYQYDLVFSDGTTVQAFLYYSATDAYYTWVVFLSGVLAFLTFSLFFVLFVHRKLRYIQQLKTELDILAGGDLSYQVTVIGNDELGELADGIDQMRRSIVNHQRAEEEMRLANSQLVTAMSHDLRTPLTSLMAYLELLERGKYEDETQLHHFISRSLQKVLQIKTMADQLFEYFLVYTSEWEEPRLQPVDADELLQQFWREYAFSLESKGFVVQTAFSELNGIINVHIELLRRAFDNLYSNLTKYADSSIPITIAFQRVKETVCLEITNSIQPLANKQESTNIGLNTCDRICRYHHGTFETHTDKTLFVVRITLPIQQKSAVASK